MGSQNEEREPLMEAQKQQQQRPNTETRHVAMAVHEGPETGAERQWDGHLLHVCGSCDPNGVSTFAYVKYCSPVAWGHNMKRAFNTSFWKHALIFTLLFSGWVWFYIGAATHAGLVCSPEPPKHFERPLPGGAEAVGDPAGTAEQVFLTGSTWQFDTSEVDLPVPEPKSMGQPLEVLNPRTVKKEVIPATEAEQVDVTSSDIEDALKTLADNAQSEAVSVDFADLVDKAALKTYTQVAADETEKARIQAEQIMKATATQLPDVSKTVNAQILQAKQQVSEGLAQLNAQLLGGRKLLHKHDDYEYFDDDDEVDHEDEEDRKRHKEEKAEAKKLKKQLKEEKKQQKEEAKKAKHLKHEEEKAIQEADLHEAEQQQDDEFHPKPFWKEHGPMREHGHHHHHGPESPECMAAQRSVFVMWALLAISSLFGVHYAARMRTAIRTRYGIPGSRLKDCLAWLFCSPCALCQETRTLAVNNVHSGVWFGPTLLAAPAAHPFEAPQQQAVSKGEPAVDV